MTIEEAKHNIGAHVVYRSGIIKHGVITSANDWYVFVRYTGDSHSKATNARDLTFAQFVKSPSMPGFWA